MLLYLEPLPARATKGAVLKFMCDAGGIAREHVGLIEVAGGRAVVEIADRLASRLVQSLNGARFNERPVRAWTDASAPSTRRSASGEDHFGRLLRLLDVEANAEATRAKQRIARLSPAEAERAGESLVDLAIEDEHSGLGGRFIITLVKRNRTLALPWTRLGVGSPVILSPQSAEQVTGFRGVVSERGERRICVAVNELSDELEDHAAWRVDLSGDEVTRSRQRVALQQAQAATSGRLAELRQTLLGEREPRFRPPQPLAPLDAWLNASQQAAVELAMSAEDIAIIHGPPGTGKTTTVVEVVRQAIARGERVLACAPSNLAVDNLLERLIAGGERAVRLGHPARVSAELREHTLDLLVEEHPDVRVAQKLVRDALALRRKAGKYTRAKPEPGARNDMRREARELLADARRLENQAVEHILDTASVICATTTGINDDLLGGRNFDLVVIDEAGQATEPPCWIPLPRAGRLVLAGDHWQLPPTVLAPQAVAEGYAVSLMERLVGVYGEKISRLLAVQYRMHESIMGFSSLEFYDGRLEADASVAAHLLSELPGVTSLPLTETPVEFIDTAGANYDEQVEPDGESRLNPSEGQLVIRKVQVLLEAGVSARDIAVIAPYAAQVRWLRERLDTPGLEIDTVDGFQGREKEAVIVTLVRSNREGDIGFLADTRRMNVALTRARRKLLVIGDSATLAAHPFYQHLLDYFESLGAYRTVWEE